ncbi:MAG: tandem-95 repeat protein [Paracoccaceae bacterium]
MSNRSNSGTPSNPSAPNGKIAGDRQSNVLGGTFGDDVLDGKAGNDALFGGFGNDVLKGGKGNDALFGGFGDDTLKGGKGDDVLRGGFGEDKLKGGAGNDTLFGGFGDDTLRGGSGNDILLGGFGDDRLKGGDGDDTLIGGFGTDTAVFKGSIRDFLISVDSQSFLGSSGTVMRLDGAELDTFHGIEVLKFSDYRARLTGENNKVLTADDSAAIDEDEALEISTADLVANDFDFDGDVLSIKKVRDTSELGAQVSLQDGVLSYDPGDLFADLELGETATDTVTYFVTDGRGSVSKATLTITIRGLKNVDQNTAPEAIGSFDIVDLAELEALDLSANGLFQDADMGDALTYSVTLADGQPAPAWLTIDPFTGQIDGLPGAEDAGVYELSVVVTDNQGATASIPLVVNVLNRLDGTAVDGYIAGAVVFGDANGNGILDAGEVSTLTDANGEFSLIGATGDLVLLGGVDISTGLAFDGTLRAPEGATVVTPLTTLVLSFAETQNAANPDFAQAEADLKSALGLPDVDLSTVDPIALAVDGSADGVALLAAQVQVQNTVLQAAAVVDGATTDPIDNATGVQSAFAGLAEAIATDPGFSLSDSGSIQEVVQNTATQSAANSGGTPAVIDAAVLDASVSVITQSNVAIDDVEFIEGASNPIEALTEIAQVAIVSQTEGVEQLEASAESGAVSFELADLNADFTSAVEDAAGQVGDVDGDAGGPASEFLVNEFVSGNQQPYGVVTLGNGNIFYGFEGTFGNPSGRIFDTTGTPVTGDILLRDFGVRGTADFAASGTGGVVVAYALGGSINLISLTEDGALDQGGIIVVDNQPTIAGFSGPRVTTLADGNYAVTWFERDASDTFDTWVRARVVAPDGTPVTDVLDVNQTQTGFQGYPEITSLSSGGFAISFSNIDAQSVSRDIDGTLRVFNADGSPRTDEIEITPTADRNSGTDLQLVELSNGNIAVAWIALVGPLAQRVIETKIIDPSGNTVVDVTLLNEAPYVSAATVDLAQLTNDRFVAVWSAYEETPDGRDYNVKARVIDNFGNPVSDEIDVNIEESATQVASFVTALPNGGFSVMWRTDDPTQDGSASAIKSRIFDSTGQAITLPAEALIFTAAELLVTDGDPANDGLNILAVEPLSALGATITLTPDGTVAYDPTSAAGLSDFSRNAIVQDTVTVTISDGQGGTTQTVVTFAVNGTNGAPVTEPVNAPDLAVSDPVETIDLLAQASDPDADPVTVVSVFALDNFGAPVAITDNGDGTISLDPGQFSTLDPGESLVVTVSYTVSDGVDATSGSVRVTVQNTTPPNVAPTISATPSAGFAEAPDASAQDLAESGVVSFNDANVGDLVSVAVRNVTTPVWSGGALPAGLAAALQAGFSSSVANAAAPGTTPWNFVANGLDLDFLGAGETIQWTVTLQATDAQGASASTDLAFVINGTNDEPTLAGAATLQAEEAGPEVGLDLTALAADLDANDAMGYAITGAPAEGSARIENGQLFFAPGSDFDDLSGGATRDVTIEVTATDTQNATAVQTYTVTVTAAPDPNSPPQVTMGTLAADEDGAAVTLDLRTLASDAEDGAVGLTFTILSAPFEGSTTLDPDGFTLRFDPGPDFQGLNEGQAQTFSISVQATDSGGLTAQNTIDLTVTGQNDAPFVVGGPQFFFASEDGAPESTFIGAQFGDADAENQDPASLTYEIVGAVPQGNASVAAGDLTFDPAGGFQDLSDGDTRDISFDVRVTDARGAQASQTVTFRVIGQNDVPVATPVDLGAQSEDDGILLLDLLQPIADADASDTLTVVAASLRAEDGNGDALPIQDNFDGTASFDLETFNTLNDGETANVTVTYEVNDGLVTVQNTISFVVTGITDTPDMSGDDLINGTPGDDLLDGFGGNDTINGFEGRDTLLGGDDDDTLDGGADDDVLAGDAGNDLLIGGGGTNTFEISDGNDTIDVTGSDGAAYQLAPGSSGAAIDFTATFGDTTGTVIKGDDGTPGGAFGTDTFTGLETLDPNANGVSVSFAAGNDDVTVDTTANTFFLVQASLGDDTLSVLDAGFVRADYLVSGGPITFVGGSGPRVTGTVTSTDAAFNDEVGTDTLFGVHEIRGTNAEDTYIGGTGDERFLPEGGDDTVDGGDGVDLVRYDRTDIGPVFVDLRIQDGSANAFGSKSGQNFQQTLQNIEDVRGSLRRVDEFGDIIEVNGIALSGDDVITGDAADNRLRGRSGDDTLDGDDGNDRLDGEDGNDELSGSLGDDTLRGGNGDDLLDGGDGNDILEGGAGFNGFRLSEGQDTLDLGGSLGGELNVEDAPGSLSITFTFGDSTGTIDKDFAGIDTLLGLDNINYDEGAILVRSGAGNDVVEVDNSQNFFGIFYLSAGDDTVEIINGAGRADYLGTSEPDPANPGGPNLPVGIAYISDDGVRVSGTVTRLGGDSGLPEDPVGTDTLVNVSQVRGTDVDDLFQGGLGNETFLPEGGNDTVDGGDGIDLVRYDRSGLGPMEVDLQAGTANGSKNGTVFTQSLANIEDIRGSNRDFASDGSIRVQNGVELNGNDTLIGDGAENRLRGRSGDDGIDGGAGNDRLEGESGNDTLLGGLGDDTLSGGSGADTFLFNLGDGLDTITDFDALEDQIDLSQTGLSDISEITAFNDGTNLQIDYGIGGDAVILANLGPDLDETDIVFVFA